MAQGNQVDLTPATAPGIHAHIPNGHSASEFDNPSDAPCVPAAANLPAGGKALVATIIPTDKAKIRFANPRRINNARREEILPGLFVSGKLRTPIQARGPRDSELVGRQGR